MLQEVFIAKTLKKKGFYFCDVQCLRYHKEVPSLCQLFPCGIFLLLCECLPLFANLLFFSLFPLFSLCSFF